MPTAVKQYVDPHPTGVDIIMEKICKEYECIALF